MCLHFTTLVQKTNYYRQAFESVIFPRCVIINKKETTPSSLMHLSHRVDENVENLNRLIVEKSHFIASPAKVPVPDDNKITDIKNISGLHHMQTYLWVKAKANLQKQEQAYWYMSCSNCNKLSDDDSNEVFECVFCKCKQAYGAPRARGTIQLEDATSSLLAIIIGPPAENFFKCSAYDLMKGTTPNEKSDIVQKMRTSIKEDMLFYVKVVPKEKEEGHWEGMREQEKKTIIVAGRRVGLRTRWSKERKRTDSGTKPYDARVYTLDIRERDPKQSSSVEEW
ncbi:Replication factor A C-terminal domain-containing protein [Abeliophyllum distichum]|uniref:Replication factor A C-terminal domain-containing protein n=1 Tax=Abeliophyllum distichum TaxID=126358 RepID=A0ABD1RY75_9LAMI